MDILYILGRGSKHDDMELRLSLRCLEKNAKGVGRVFIVGNKPDWVQNVAHIPAEDTFQPMNNHCFKVLRAIAHGISENFLLMNDDFFMIKPFEVDKYPYFYRGKLEIYTEPDKNGEYNQYRRSLIRTHSMLQGMGIEHPLAYNVHCPIVYNSEKFAGFSNLFQDTKFDNTCFSWRCLYGNMHAKEPIIVEDTKIYDDFWQEPNETGCISTSDDCDNILKKIEEMYPNKSRWEK